MLGAIHAAVWTHLAERMREAVEQWVESLPAHRANVELGSMLRGGYPFAICWTFTTPKIRATWAFGEVSALASTLTVSSQIWHPDTLLINANGLMLSVDHRSSRDHWYVEASTGSWTFGPAIPQGTFELRFDFVDVAAGLGGLPRTQPLLAGANMVEGTVRFTRSPDDGPHQTIGMNLEGVSSPLSNQISLQDFGMVRIEASLHGSPGDLSLEDIVDWRDSGGILDITHLEIEWPPIEVFLDGTITLDERIRPMGAGTVDVRGANALIDHQVALGHLTHGQATAVKLALAVMTRPAKDGGEPTVQTSITAQGGQLQVGPFTIARLSSLIR